MAQTVSERRTGREVKGGAVAALVTTVAYWAWLGWDRERVVQPDGHETGPYETWQVAGLVVTLLVCGVIVARLGAPVAAVVATTAALTVSWSISAATSDDSGLWPIGAALVCVGTLIVSIPVAALAYQTRRAR
ncbi:hypothetical protein [Actinomadura hibisca]|uniref:hypothetical protein n=1 Tax=Actinomadura hibisca TaxID=68565 RepID=UPI00082F32B2|nr:hypothetical protein [Actinomadura hibisca]